MATYYLDLENGNDANDGLSFANRWKTFTSGATLARIAPGDTIRVMGSPDPTSLGINATWTNKNKTVTLASALNALITDCNSAWTASANVTCTTSGTFRSSTASASIAIASGFTTGKVAYFDLGSNQNYSAYQGITFWILVNPGTIGAGVLTIDLCSDALGATPVDTFAIPAISQSNQWVPVYIDKGSALGASIRSISINAISDPGTATILIDNISTVKAAGADNLNLCSLISKNTTGEYWWAIRSINGTTVILDGTPNMATAADLNGYYGTTATVATYKRETIKTALVASFNTVFNQIQDSGSAGNPITFSGGWDRTNMSTQSLEYTWMDGQSGIGYGLYGNAKQYITLEKFAFSRYYRGLYIDSNPANWTLNGKLYCGNNWGAGLFINGAGSITFGEIHVWGSCTEGGIVTTNGDTITASKIRLISIGQTSSVVSGFFPNGLQDWDVTEWEVSNCAWHGFNGSSTGAWSQIHVGTMTVKDNALQGIWFGVSNNRVEIDAIVASGNGGSGVQLASSAGWIRIGSITSTGNSSYGCDLSTPGQIDLLIRSLTTSGNGGSFHNAVINGKTVILNSSLAEATKWAADSLSLAGFGSCSFRNFNGTAGDHRTMFNGGYSITGLGAARMDSETSVRHTASGLSWRISFGAYQYGGSSRFPIIVPVARYAVKAGALVTQSLWVRRNHLNVSGTLRIKGGQIGGVPADVTATISVAVDTWEQLTITFTPSETGTVEIELTGYASDALFSNTRYLYFDDESHSQA